MLKRFIILLSFLLLPLLIGSIGSYATVESIYDWYITLNKPNFNPPNWIFGPVWTVLYLLMGYSSFRVFLASKSDERNQALTLYFLQLFFNLLWSILFFKFHFVGIALIEISFLLALLILMVTRFKQVDKIAAYLNIPYLIWVSFATILNASIYYLNA